MLVEAFGDFDLHTNRANESHSVIAWDTGDGDAYAAAIDNEELEDVDIFEITDPRNPELIAETDCSSAPTRTPARSGCPSPSRTDRWPARSSPPVSSGGPSRWPASPTRR